VAAPPVGGYPRAGMFHPSSVLAAAARCVLLLLAAVTVPACGGSDARLESRYVAVHNTMTALGLAQTGPISQGSLSEGDDVQVVVPLEANRCTVFLALGSGGVSDLDVRVLDTNGTTVAESDTASDQAAVRICPIRTGDYAVVLRAARGDGSYALASWSTGAGGDGATAVAQGGGRGTCAAPLPLAVGEPEEGTTEGAPSEMTGRCIAGAAPERVYSLEVEERTHLDVVLESAYDGALYLRRSCQDAQSEVACNDDSPEENVRRSQISATLDPGTYSLVVDGYGEEAGTYQLIATMTALRPIGEVCAAADAIAPGQVVSGSTATGNDYFQASCAGGARSPDQVYSLEVRQPSRLRVRQQTDHDGALHLRRACAEPTSEIACNDDFVDPRRSHLRGRLDPGRYFLIADGYGEGAAGAFSFTADLEPADGSGGRGDTCATAEPLTSLGTPASPTEVTVDTFPMRDDLAGSCGGSGGPDVVYALDVPARGLLTATFAEAEMAGAVYLRRRSCDDPDAEVACVPMQYAAGGELMTVVSSGRYYLIVDGSGPDDFGSAALRASFEDLAGADRACRRARRLRPGRQVSDSTSGADALFRASCAEGASSPERVYSLRLRRRSRVRLAVSSEYDAAIHLRSECADPTTEVACNDDHEDNRHALIEQELDPGTYAVFVDGYQEGNAGDFTLEVDVTPL